MCGLGASTTMIALTGMRACAYTTAQNVCPSVRHACLHTLACISAAATALDLAGQPVNLTRVLKHAKPDSFPAARPGRAPTVAVQRQRAAALLGGARWRNLLWAPPQAV